MRIRKRLKFISRIKTHITEYLQKSENKTEARDYLEIGCIFMLQTDTISEDEFAKCITHLNKTYDKLGLNNGLFS